MQQRDKGIKPNGVKSYGGGSIVVVHGEMQRVVPLVFCSSRDDYRATQTNGVSNFSPDRLVSSTILV